MNQSIATLMCKISTSWVIDDIRDIKTCEIKTDDYTARRIGSTVDPVVLGVGGNAVFQYRYDREAIPDEHGAYTASCMVTTTVSEIHVSLDEENKCITASICTRNSIYILHADIDISGTNVAVFGDIIQKINEASEKKNELYEL